MARALENPLHAQINQNCPDIISEIYRLVNRYTRRHVSPFYLFTTLTIPPMSLSLSAQKVQDKLNSLGYNYTVIEHKDSTRTAQEAADRAGCALGQIVKSLIFKGRDSGKPILILTSGVNRVDEKRISKYAGEAIVRPDADFVRAVTGFAIGGVPPIGHAVPMETYVDEDFLQYRTIWAAAGTPNAIFELKTEDLQKMTNGKVVQIK